jgi:hypothetical protein
MIGIGLPQGTATQGGQGARDHQPERDRPATVRSIGGSDQWLQIRINLIRDNLALLVRHDGPGRSWEQYFTVVQWDHRGAAETMDRNGKAEFLRPASEHGQGDLAGPAGCRASASVVECDVSAERHAGDMDDAARPQALLVAESDAARTLRPCPSTPGWSRHSFRWVSALARTQIR